MDYKTACDNGIKCAVKDDWQVIRSSCFNHKELKCTIIIFMNVHNSPTITFSFKSLYFHVDSLHTQQWNANKDTTTTHTDTKQKFRLDESC